MQIRLIYFDSEVIPVLRMFFMFIFNLFERGFPLCNFLNFCRCAFADNGIVSCRECDHECDDDFDD